MKIRQQNPDVWAARISTALGEQGRAVKLLDDSFEAGANYTAIPSYPLPAGLQKTPRAFTSVGDAPTTTTVSPASKRKSVCGP